MSSHQKTAYFGEVLTASEQNRGAFAGVDGLQVVVPDTCSVL